MNRPISGASNLENPLTLMTGAEERISRKQPVCTDFVSVIQNNVYGGNDEMARADVAGTRPPLVASRDSLETIPES